jgi:uncharacterized phage protein (TIGR02218 family)
MTTQDYIDQENAEQRQPVELYHIWYGDTHYRHTSNDASVVYGGYTWTPATIQRQAIKRSNDFAAREVEIVFAKTSPAVSRYLANSPVSLSWVRIYKVFRDQDPIEAQLIFLGQIVSVSIKGAQAQATCQAIEHLLNQPLLKFWYQPECNHTLFDCGCGLAKDDFKITPTVTVDVTGTILTAAAFGAETDGHWTLGYVEFEGEQRLIIDHSGNDITIMTPFSSLEDTDEVDVYPGCDGNVDTCRDKFSNLAHFLGFPFIPLDNPALWIGKE